MSAKHNHAATRESYTKFKSTFFLLALCTGCVAGVAQHEEPLRVSGPGSSPIAGPIATSCPGAEFSGECLDLELAQALAGDKTLLAWAPCADDVGEVRDDCVELLVPGDAGSQIGYELTSEVCGGGRTCFGGHRVASRVIARPTVYASRTSTVVNTELEFFRTERHRFGFLYERAIGYVVSEGTINTSETKVRITGELDGAPLDYAVDVIASSTPRSFCEKAFFIARNTDLWTTIETGFSSFHASTEGDRTEVIVGTKESRIKTELSTHALLNLVGTIARATGILAIRAVAGACHVKDFVAELLDTVEYDDAAVRDPWLPRD